MHETVERTLRVVEDAVAAKSEADLSAKPQGKWSAAEIIEHLAASYHSTAKGMERVIAHGPPGERPTLKQRLATFVVVTMGRLPEGRQAPEFTIPKGIGFQQAMTLLRDGVELMDSAITRCEEQFGKSTKIANHPILGPMTAQQWRKFHFVHAQHHAKQIQQRSATQMRAAA